MWHGADTKYCWHSTTEHCSTADSHPKRPKFIKKNILPPEQGIFGRWKTTQGLNFGSLRGGPLPSRNGQKILNTTQKCPNLVIKLQSPCHEESSPELQWISTFVEGLLFLRGDPTEKRGLEWREKIVSNVWYVPLCFVPKAEHKLI